MLSSLPCSTIESVTHSSIPVQHRASAPLEAQARRSSHLARRRCCTRHDVVQRLTASDELGPLEGHAWVHSVINEALPGAGLCLNEWRAQMTDDGWPGRHPSSVIRHPYPPSVWFPWTASSDQYSPIVKLPAANRGNGSYIQTTTQEHREREHPSRCKNRTLVNMNRKIIKFTRHRSPPRGQCCTSDDG